MYFVLYRRTLEVIGAVENDGSITMIYGTGFDGSFSWDGFVI